MNCERFRTLLDSYLDQELGPAVAIDAQEHLQACQKCRIALDERRRLSAAVKTSSDAAFSLPVGLREGVLARLRLASKPRPSRAWLLPSSVGFVVVAALAVAAGSALTFLFAVPSDQERLIDNAISAHARSLQVDHLTDVASSDPDVVKGWFKGQNHTVPIVRDLTSAGFLLLGGRLEYLYRHPVAAVVYQHKGRTINMYMWSAEEESAPIEQFNDEGFNLVLWRSSGLAFCVISDLGAADLLGFTRVFTSSPEPA